jgi:pyruvate formate lyase activating enzyme
MKSARRDFLKIAASAALGCPLLCGVSAPAAVGVPHQALFWTKEGEKGVRCGLCPRGCFVPNGARGHCRVRENRGGVYYTLVYGNPAALNLDPIEKKPLFHFYPGTDAYSLATVGCNIECLFCQNWQLSQSKPDEVESRTMSPDDIIKAALKAGAKSIAFTYSEPTVFYEYMRDIAAAAKGTGLKTVLISNGYIQAKPQRELLRLLDGVKIDFKSFSESFYSDICSAHLKPVLDSLERIKGEGVWLEMVMLTVPTLNDKERELHAMTQWIRQKLGSDVPIHFTRFHPMYKLNNLPPTPVGTLEKARRIALEAGLHFPYAGNVPGHPGENTYCPSCKKVVIRRDGYRIAENRVTGGKCGHCGAPIAGVW